MRSGLREEWNDLASLHPPAAHASSAQPCWSPWPRPHLSLWLISLKLRPTTTKVNFEWRHVLCMTSLQSICSLVLFHQTSSPVIRQCVLLLPHSIIGIRAPADRPTASVDLSRSLMPTPKHCLPVRIRALCRFGTGHRTALLLPSHKGVLSDRSAGRSCERFTTASVEVLIVRLDELDGICIARRVSFQE